MDSDDDYQQFSIPKEPSSPIHERKLKRLKKATRVSSDLPISQPIDPIPSPEIPTHRVSSPKIPIPTKNSDQESSETPEAENQADSRSNVLESQGLDGGRGSENELDDLFDYRDRTVDISTVGVSGEEGGPFGVSDVVEEEIEGKGDDVGEKFGDEKMEEKELQWDIKKKKRSSLTKEVEEKKKGKKRGKSADEKGNIEPPARTKRKLEKERKAYLEQLHAESQRLLRETRDAAFKPVPLVQKPISSILEKIRQRKLEVSKKASMLHNHVEDKEVVIDLYPEEARNDNTGEKGNREEGDKDMPLVQEESNDAGVTNVEISNEPELNKIPVGKTTVGDKEHEELARDKHLVNEENNEDDIHIDSSSGPASFPSTSKTVLSDMELDEESKSTFRAPIDDTQDLFSDSDQSDEEDLEDSQEDSPVEEVLAPSVLTMNLLLDSAPPDDDSSDEEFEDKENIDPQSRKPSDPVKAFMDDEAEEEDDSDNDLARFKENEDEEEDEDSEEFNDLIVPGYEEKPSDNIRRDELHQMWLDQQDAAATDNVLQRLKCGRKQHKGPAALEEEEDEDDTDDEDYGENSMDAPKKTASRRNSKKPKEMFLSMFDTKEDVYVSDDEETEEKLLKMRLLEKAEESVSLLSPAEDENSREVFGLIKKLNIAPDPKKKPKSSSFFDTLITGGNSNSSSRSSFLGRAPSSSLPSLNKNSSSNFRSFIFGRDDSNSRSGITTESSNDMAHENSNQATRTGSAKFSSSQSKSSSQSVAQASSSSSLFEILKRSSQSDRNNTIGQSQVAVQFAAFKSEKKIVKIQARN